jgi:hypothetical protein
MSTEPYPEVTGDESGIVPPQNTRPPEWPKKLRTLTAAELDRLTIDNNGRFYWDGKLVDYGTDAKPQPDRTADSLTRSLDILDRASYDLGGRKMTTIEGQLAQPAPAAENGAADRNVVRAQAATAAAETAHATRGERNVTLSRGQTVAAVVLVLLVAIGAFGMATYGYVAARDWGCKTGAFKDGCPLPPPAPKAPERHDIPA